MQAVQPLPDLAALARSLASTGFVVQGLCAVAKPEGGEACLRLLAVGYSVSATSLEAPFELLKISPSPGSLVSPLRGWQRCVWLPRTPPVSSASHALCTASGRANPMAGRFASRGGGGSWTWSRCDCGGECRCLRETQNSERTATHLCARARLLEQGIPTCG